MERIFADGDRFAGGEPVGAGDVAGFDVAAEFAFETFELTESGGGGLARVVAGVVGDDDGEGGGHRFVVKLRPVHGRARRMRRRRNIASVGRSQS